MGFIDLQQWPLIEPVPGCRTRTPHLQNLMLSRLVMDAGAEVPMHQHPHEQGGVVVEGTMELTIGEETRLLKPGDIYLIEADVPHRAIAIDGPVVVVDIFSPIREDYAMMANSDDIE